MTEKKVLTLAVLAFGPLLSVIALSSLVPVESADRASMEAALVLLWCPFLFFSIPSLVLQNSRDETLASWTGPLGSAARALVLVPYSLARGGQRAANLVALSAWTLLALAYGSSLVAVTGRIAGTLLG